MRKRLLMTALAVAAVAVSSVAVVANANAGEEPAKARTMSAATAKGEGTAALSAAEGPCYWTIEPTVYTQYGAAVYNAAEAAVACDVPITKLDVRVALVNALNNSIAASYVDPQYNVSFQHAFAAQTPCVPGIYLNHFIVMITLPAPYYEQPVIEQRTAPVTLSC